MRAPSATASTVFASGALVQQIVRLRIEIVLRRRTGDDDAPANVLDILGCLVPVIGKVALIIVTSSFLIDSIGRDQSR
jgi:hypothetical protein